MHVLLKQIQMLTTFDKYKLLYCYKIIITIYIYILKYVVKEINLLFFKYVQMFHHKSRGNIRQSIVRTPPMHGWACSLTCLR
jgi:hypothetical protein